MTALGHARYFPAESAARCRIHAAPVSQKALANYREQHQARLPFTEAEVKKIK